MSGLWDAHRGRVVDREAHVRAEQPVQDSGTLEQQRGSQQPHVGKQNPHVPLE